MDPFELSTGQPTYALSAGNLDDSLITHSVAASGTAFLGEQDSVTFIAIPESHPHDQQRRQPLESIETLSTAPFLIGFGSYMAVRRAYHVVQKWRDPNP